MSKTLPMGTVFPFDFGFIPKTLGQDGDPLDVLVIMDEPVYPGCLIRTRLLGVLEARQEERREKKFATTDWWLFPTVPYYMEISKMSTS